MRPLIGGYYWLPRPTAGGVAWEVLACYDVGHSGGDGHADFWPGVVALLAAAWGLDPATLARRLADRYTGLPRGRVSRTGRLYYLNHGDDVPVPDGIKRVTARFGLGGIDMTIVAAFDPHERMLRGDPEALQDALGAGLGLRGI